MAYIKAGKARALAGPVIAVADTAGVADNLTKSTSGTPGSFPMPDTGHVGDTMTRTATFAAPDTASVGDTLVRSVAVAMGETAHATDAASQSAISVLFRSGVAWITPIPSSPALHPNSAAMVSVLAAPGANRVAEIGAYGIPIYEADINTPSWELGNPTKPLTIRYEGVGAPPLRSTSYIVGFPCNVGGYTYRCTRAGTTAASAPTFPTAYGATVTDGTTLGGVIWTNCGPNLSGWGDNDIAYTPVRIPDNAVPSFGTDGHIAINDRVNDWQLCLWRAVPTKTGGGVITGGTTLVTTAWGTSGAPGSPYTPASTNYGTGTAAQVSNTLRLQVTGSGYAGSITYARLDQVGTDLDYVDQVTLPAASEFYCDFWVQLVSSSMANGYRLSFSPGQVNLDKKVDGVRTSLVGLNGDPLSIAGATIKFRFRRVTSTGELKARWWTGATEPTTWQIDTLDTSISDPGGFGFGLSSGNPAGTYTMTLASGGKLTSGAAESVGTVTAWTFSWGGIYPLSGNGSSSNPTYNVVPWPSPTTKSTVSRATGAGIASAAGAVTVDEVAALSIHHALMFASDDIQGPRDSGPFLFPATTTDGQNPTSTSTVIEGMRAQLDPTINLAAISGIHPVELAIGVALQTYGMYATDQTTTLGGSGSRIGICCQVPVTAAQRTVYTAAGLSGDWLDLSHLPWSSLRILASWDAGSTAVTIPLAETAVATDGLTRSGAGAVNVAETAAAADSLAKTESGAAQQWAESFTGWANDITIPNWTDDINGYGTSSFVSQSGKARLRAASGSAFGARAERRRTFASGGGTVSFTAEIDIAAGALQGVAFRQGSNYLGLQFAGGNVQGVSSFGGVTDSTSVVPHGFTGTMSVRLYRVGNDFKAKVWQGAEPSGWTIDWIGEATGFTTLESIWIFSTDDGSGTFPRDVDLLINNTEVQITGFGTASIAMPETAVAADSLSKSAAGAASPTETASVGDSLVIAATRSMTETAAAADSAAAVGGTVQWSETFTATDGTTVPSWSDASSYGTHSFTVQSNKARLRATPASAFGARADRTRTFPSGSGIVSFVTDLEVVANALQGVTLRDASGNYIGLQFYNGNVQGIRSVGGVQGNTSNVTHGLTGVLKILIKRDGNDFKAKIWQGTEPGTWTIDWTSGASSFGTLVDVWAFSTDDGNGSFPRDVDLLLDNTGLTTGA